MTPPKDDEPASPPGRPAPAPPRPRLIRFVFPSEATPEEFKTGIRDVAERHLKPKPCRRIDRLFLIDPSSPLPPEPSIEPKSTPLYGSHPGLKNREPSTRAEPRCRRL
jgi:hypothetical protein